MTSILYQMAQKNELTKYSFPAEGSKMTRLWMIFMKYRLCTLFQTLGKGRVVPGAVGPGAPGGVQPAEKQGKFSVADFESPGQVNGKEPHEMAEDLATVQEAEKPWKKPGELNVTYLPTSRKPQTNWIKVIL